MTDLDPVRGASVRQFSISSFPCSGADWLARLLALHPNILVADCPDGLGPLGGEQKSTAEDRTETRDATWRAALQAAAANPALTHVGIVVVAGAGRSLPGPEFVVLRDGRDVLVQWTLRQLSRSGAALQRFLKPEKAGRMPEIARRFVADPRDVITANPGLLLSDYDWVRYGAYLWDDAVTGHSGMLGAIADGKLRGPDPIEVFFEEARADPWSTFKRLVGLLGLDSSAVEPFVTGTDPVIAREPDPARIAEWEIGAWRRFFTPRAATLFKMDASQGLEYVTKEYGDDSWEGDCPPWPGAN